MISFAPSQISQFSVLCTILFKAQFFSANFLPQRLHNFCVLCVILDKTQYFYNWISSLTDYTFFCVLCTILSEAHFFIIEFASSQMTQFCVYYAPFLLKVIYFHFIRTLTDYTIFCVLCTILVNISFLSLNLLPQRLHNILCLWAILVKDEFFIISFTPSQIFCFMCHCC